MDNSLFPPKWKNTVYDKSDLLSIYMHEKGTRENSYYFDKELPSKNNDSNKKIEYNKVGKENKKNILDNKLPKVSASNKTT